MAVCQPKADSGSVHANQSHPNPSSSFGSVTFLDSLPMPTKAIPIPNPSNSFGSDLHGPALLLSTKKVLQYIVFMNNNSLKVVAPINGKKHPNIQSNIYLGQKQIQYSHYSEHREAK